MLSFSYANVIIKHKGGLNIVKIRNVILIFSLMVALMLAACGNSDSNIDIDTNEADYNSKGEYKPVDSMSNDEIRSELEGMLDDSLGN